MTTSTATPTRPPVTPSPAQLPPAPAATTRTKVRGRALISGAFGQPRFVRDRPPALLEHIAYATSGEWTTEHDGWRRAAALTYARLVAIPVSTLCYLLAWLSARPSRFATALVVGGTLWLALATLPSAVAAIAGWTQ